MGNIQISSTRTSFLPGHLNVQATEAQTPFISFDNGVHFVMQADGNIVVYNGKGSPLWGANSNIGSGDASKLILRFQDNGNLVLYYDGRPTWETKTAGKGRKLVALDSCPFLMILDKDGNVSWYSPQDVK